MNIEIFGAWVAVFLTLAIFSFLYKDNPFYKIAEHLFVGVSAGYWMSMFFWTQIQPNLFGRLWPSSQYSESGVWYRIYDLLGVVAGNVFPDGGIDKGHDLHFIYLIPLALGIMMLLAKKYQKMIVLSQKITLYDILKHLKSQVIWELYIEKIFDF